MDEYITRLNGHIAHLEGMVMSVQGQQVKLATDLLQEKIEHNAAKERIAELEAENARLREALRPFEEEAAAWENYSGDERLVEAFPDYHGKLAVGDLRAARAALKGEAP